MQGRRRLRHDEAGAVAVVEGLFVALLVSGAILFVNLQQGAERTASTGPAPQLDAAGILAALQQGQYASLSFEDAVWALAEGDGTPAAAMAALLDALTQGGGFALRLGNGFGSLDLLASGAAPPGGTGAAAAALGPGTWQTAVPDIFLAPPTPIAFPLSLVPGDDYVPNGNNGVATQTGHPPATYACVRAPTQSTQGPGPTPWATLWPPGTTNVPADAPLGVWEFHVSAACDDFPLIVCIPDNAPLGDPDQDGVCEDGCVPDAPPLGQCNPGVCTNVAPDLLGEMLPDPPCEANEVQEVIVPEQENVVTTGPTYVRVDVDSDADVFALRPFYTVELVVW